MSAALPDRVRLGLVADNDIDWLVEMLMSRDAVGEHNWPLEPTQRRDIDDIQSRVTTLASELPTVAGGELVVELTSTAEAIGTVSWRTERWGPSERSSCPAIGIAILPAFRGQGLGTEAQRLLVHHLFSHFPEVHRVQSDTAADNPAEQRALIKAGFVYEGTVRDAEYRDGRYHDHLVYSVLRREWESW